MSGGREGSRTRRCTRQHLHARSPSPSNPPEPPPDACRRYWRFAAPHSGRVKQPSPPGGTSRSNVRTAVPNRTVVRQGQTRPDHETRRCASRSLRIVEPVQQAGDAGRAPSRQMMRDPGRSAPHHPRRRGRALLRQALPDYSLGDVRSPRSSSKPRRQGRAARRSRRSLMLLSKLPSLR